MKNSMDRFIKENSLDTQSIEHSGIINAMLSDMRKSLEGAQSPLAMLPAYISIDSPLPAGRPVIAIDAGGTNFRSALVTFGRGGETLIEHLRTEAMPGSQGEVSKDRFFGLMADYISGLLEFSQTIGFCFSYPVEIQENRDGRLLYFTKEIKAPEVEGQLICESLSRALRDRGHKKQPAFTLLNDTVATLLAGKSRAGGRSYSSYIGFILGTGTNAAYIEQTANISKKCMRDVRLQIINAESGMFGKLPLSAIDRAFDLKTVNPRAYLFEKMTAGAYLGPLGLEYIKAAAAQGIFRPEDSAVINSISTMTTRDLAEYAMPGAKARPHSALDSLSRSSAEGAKKILRAVLERASLFAALKLGAFVIKTGEGADPERPVCITADGSTFYRVPGFKERAEHHLDRIITVERGLHYEIIRVENAPLIGAAIAGGLA